MGHSKISGARAPVTTVVGVVALMWSLCWVGAAASARSVAVDNRDLLETESEWHFADDDDIRAFDNATAATNATAPAPAAKAPSGLVVVANSDFEGIGNVSATTLADATSTAIVNWTPGGAGVQILLTSAYGAPQYLKTAKGNFCIHLNNPASAANGTQGSLSTTLATNPANGHAFTVHYDVCRCPDAPINVWPAIKVSAVTGNTTHDFTVHSVPYNSTDTVGHSTWVKQSMIYTGTGAATQIKFESMSEKYGPIIDNVQVLTGKHPLAAAPLGKVARLCQRALPLVTVVALASFHIF